MEDFKEKSSSSASLVSDHRSPNPDPLSIDPEIWLMAEQRIQEILYVVQPNIVSDKRRKEVVNYVRQLINGYFGTEVLAFGSVPLKTYLPDGDVDLTVFCYQDWAEDFSREVCNVLKREEGPEFRVKDIQYIDAQVKVVKCTMKGGIAVDISFNQISGLCTLCFLEQADQRIGRDHLFKRSVILIKAWCYYESRLLGAHNGLILTYGLEIMVLYIISLYHESLRGPLEVLYRFLEYFSQFDWDKYCLTIHGPVALSSLAESTAETIEDGKEGIFLSKEFLKHCRDMFVVPIKAHEGEVNEFLVKHLNILDPLKDNNNLGRSVGLGSFYRIVAAFSYGLQTLKKILMRPGVMMGEELEKYFESTLERNGQGERPDLRVPVPAFGTGKYELFDYTGDSDSYYGGIQYSQLYNNYCYVWDENTLTWTMQPDQNGLSGMLPDVVVPRAPFFHQNSPLLPAANYGPFIPRRSRGTGTYIPETTRSFYKDTCKKTKKRDPGPSRQDLWLKSGQKSNPMVDDGEENSSPLDLSLESFPLLQATTKAITSEISETGDRSQFKTFPRLPSPWGLPSQVASKETDRVAWSSFISTLDATVMGAQMQQESAENHEETTPVQHYELEDNKDFPPLSL